VNGWHPDPFQLHEERFLKNGEATALIRDNGIGAYDEPPGPVEAVLAPPPASPATSSPQTAPSSPAIPAPETATAVLSPPPAPPAPPSEHTAPSTPAVSAPETVTGLNGWHPDPFQLHEERFLKNGEATALIRDNGIGAYDEPPGPVTAVLSSPPASSAPPSEHTAPSVPSIPAPETVAPEQAPPPPTASTDRPPIARPRTCPRCGSVLRPDANLCENCGPRTGSGTGWFQDPAGRWEARFFEDGEMTNQVRVAGATYLDSKRNFADADVSRIEAILLDGEQLLHEAWVYNDKRGILALTSYRLLKYRTGRRDRSSRSGTGSLTLDWELVWNPQYFDVARRSATAAQPGAPEPLRSGLMILAGYRSGPFTKVGGSDPELVGGKTMTLSPRLAQENGGGAPAVPAAVESPSGPERQLSRRLAEAFRGRNKAESPPDSAQAKQSQAWELQVVGRTPSLLRIDEVLTAAAPR
jgi:hypothetical protein